jgi:hypothetical protein
MRFTLHTILRASGAALFRHFFLLLTVRCMVRPLHPDDGHLACMSWPGRRSAPLLRGVTSYACNVFFLEVGAKLVLRQCLLAALLLSDVSQRAVTAVYLAEQGVSYQTEARCGVITGVTLNHMMLACNSCSCMFQGRLPGITVLCMLEPFFF